MATIYVKKDAAGNNNGQSWADSYTDLQDALATAEEGDEIWVAAGTYKPTDDGDRNIGFELKKNVKIYGGFAGNESSLEERDWENNQTILSGDIGEENKGSDNSFTVVLNFDTNKKTVLDGFTITDAKNDEGNGGGILSFDGDATFENLIIDNNKAAFGGGMYNDPESNPTLTNITFIGNKAIDNTEFDINGNGGGLFNQETNPKLTNITFIDNKSDVVGGGLYNFRSNPSLTNVTFINNSAKFSGGALYNDNSTPEIINNIFYNNSARNGAAILNLEISNPSIINSTFVNNNGDEGGAIFSDSFAPTTVKVVNSILWGNSGAVDGNQITDSAQANTEVKSSIVEGGYEGEGNQDVDPLFVDLENGDFRLQGNSPAINQGDNEEILVETDLDGNTRIINEIVDIGPYEFDQILNGTDDQDLIIGTNNDNQINGFDSKDTLAGGDGDDSLSGGKGKDIIDGEDDNDLIKGGKGDDTLSGGKGQDTIEGGEGENLLEGGDDQDQLTGGEDKDTLLGGSGEDTLTGGDGSDVVDGEDDNDLIKGGKGDDTLSGGKGQDTIEGGEGENLLEGGGGKDELTGGKNKDTIAGGKGDDTLMGGKDKDVLEGKKGEDLLLGEGGKDELIGGQDNDILVGGSGEDTLTGNAGEDQFVFNFPDEGVDKITDFVASEDLIVVSAEGFGGELIPGETLPESQFVLSGEDIKKRHRFIYDLEDGSLFYDADGKEDSFDPIELAKLTDNPVITSTDILII